MNILLEKVLPCIANHSAINQIRNLVNMQAAGTNPIDPEWLKTCWNHWLCELGLLSFNPTSAYFTEEFNQI